MRQVLYALGSATNILHRLSHAYLYLAIVSIP